MNAPAQDKPFKKSPWPCAILLLGLLATAFAWRAASVYIEEQAQARFAQRVKQITVAV